jgi:two-component SAPR family response regulator
MSARQPLSGLKVLIVEDQFLIADDLSRAVTRLGAMVVGPCPTVAIAQATLADQPVDFAVLDLNLRGDQVFPVAEELARRAIPFAFATGYEAWVIPPEFQDRPLLHKPVGPADLERTLSGLRVAMRRGA